MRNLNVAEMENQVGGKLDAEIAEFLDGVACGVGLATLAVGGWLLTFYGCGRALGLL